MTSLSPPLTAAEWKAEEAEAYARYNAICAERAKATIAAKARREAACLAWEMRHGER